MSKHTKDRRNKPEAFLFEKPETQSDKEGKWLDMRSVIGPNMGKAITFYRLVDRFYGLEVAGNIADILDVVSIGALGKRSEQAVEVLKSMKEKPAKVVFEGTQEESGATESE